MKRILIILGIGMLTVGCRTRYVPVETVRTEFRDRVNEVRVTDSVTNDRFVYVKGDSVYITQWRDRTRTVTKHDTVRTEKTDTIRLPYPVEKRVEVERKRRWWETGLLWGAGISLILSAVLLPLCYFKRVTKTVPIIKQ